jgi:hypothetical protein
MTKELPYLDSLTIATSGTPQQFSQSGVTIADPTGLANPGQRVVPWLFSRIEIRPLASNTGTILVGYIKNGTLVKPVVLAASAFPLVLKSANKHVAIDLNDLYFDASANGQTLMIIGERFRL